LTHQLYIVVVSFIGGGNRREIRQFGTKTFRHPLKKTVRHQDISAPVEKDSSAPRHFGTVEKKCQIGTAFSFKHEYPENKMYIK
jgi:hypothetical protein